MTGYDGKSRLAIRESNRMADGDTCHALVNERIDHAYSHVDVPRNVIEGGKDMMDYPTSEWVFRFPHFIDVSVGEGTLVTVDMIIGDPSEIAFKTEFIFSRTGMESGRSDDLYMKNGVGLS